MEKLIIKDPQFLARTWLKDATLISSGTRVLDFSSGRNHADFKYA